MDTAADRLEFAPPPQPGLMRSFVLAVVAHILLVLALMNGLRWTRESQEAAVEAELWSAVPQQAAPKPVPVPPTPPAPPPQPAPPVVKAPEPPVNREADIALEREKQKRALEQERRQEELERQRAERAKIEAQKKRDEELARKKELEQQRLAEAKRKEDEAKRKREEQQARDEKMREQLRQDTIKRNLALAGTGAPNATGTAAHTSGPSGNWAGRVVGKVRPNIVYTGERSSAWHAEVDVRLAPDGTIVSRRITKSNAPAAWNDAVLRALDRTQVLPRDTDGTVPRQGTIVFTPD